MINKHSKVLILGGRGMVGSSITSLLLKKKIKRIYAPSKKELNLLDEYKIKKYLSKIKVDLVILAAAKVGGIYANSTNPVDFLYENLKIEINVINQCNKNNINNLIFLGSSCIYPGNKKKPLKETDLLNGKLEKTNESYALAKITGIKLCQAYNQQFNRKYISVMPCNLYGPNDNYDPINSHVIPGLIYKFHIAKIKNEKTVFVWGDGSPLREFLNVKDLSKAIIKILSSKIQDDIINIGSGHLISIKDLAKKISKIVGYKGSIQYDKKKPNGTMYKLLDSNLINKIGWKPTIGLDEGIKQVYSQYKKTIKF